MINLNPVINRHQFKNQRQALATELYRAPVFDRGEVHAQKIIDPAMATKEIRYVNLEYKVPDAPDQWERLTEPNMPWAEDHFLERISGLPLNPPPSNEWWPYNRNKNAEHKKDEKFSHTYPERFWPRNAGTEFESHRGGSMRGLRYAYGDLHDLIDILKKNPRSRQAYLPIWFPEDLNAAALGDRVPCTLGYHLMQDDVERLNMYYPMRSCDFLRFMVDDIYMAGRLLQWVADEIPGMKVGRLNMSISSLHVFKGDDYTLSRMIDPDDEEEDSWLSGVSG